MKRSAPVLVRADGTRVELAGYDICIRVPPLVSHVSYSPAGVRLTVSLSKGERIEDGDRVVYSDGSTSAADDPEGVSQRLGDLADRITALLPPRER